MKGIEAFIFGYSTIQSIQDKMYPQNVCLHGVTVSRECPHPLSAELARTVADHIATLVYEGQHGEVESTAVFEEALARAVELAELWAERGLEVGGVSAEHRVVARSPRAEVWALPRLQDICGPLYPLLDVVQRWADCELYALFEPHGGGLMAAQFAAAHLPHNLADHPRLADDPPMALRDAFRLTDRHFLRRAALLQERSDGCSAVCALRKADTLHVAWLGACGAALLAEGGSRPLTQAHTLQAQEEQKAIRNVGGFLEQDPMGVWRIQDGPPLSRALGFLEHKPLISGEPDIVTLSLKDEHALILKSESLMPGDNSPETLMLVPLSPYGRTHLDSIYELLVGPGIKLPPSRNGSLVDDSELERYPVSEDHVEEQNGHSEVHKEEEQEQLTEYKKEISETPLEEVNENGVNLEPETEVPTSNQSEVPTLNQSEETPTECKDQKEEPDKTPINDEEIKKEEIKTTKSSVSVAKIKSLSNKSSSNMKSQNEVKKTPSTITKRNNLNSVTNGNKNGSASKSQISSLNSSKPNIKMSKSTINGDKQIDKKVINKTPLIKTIQSKITPEKKEGAKEKSNPSKSTRTIAIKVPKSSTNGKCTKKLTVSTNGSSDAKEVCDAMFASMTPEMCKEMERKGSVTATLIINNKPPGSPAARRKSLSALPNKTLSTTQRKSSLPSQKPKLEERPQSLSKPKTPECKTDKTKKEAGPPKMNDNVKTKPKLNGKPSSCTTSKTQTNGIHKEDAKSKTVAKSTSKSALKSNGVKTKVPAVNSK